MRTAPRTFLNKPRFYLPHYNSRIGRKFGTIPFFLRLDRREQESVQQLLGYYSEWRSDFRGDG